MGGRNMELKPLIEDPDHYIKSYQAFINSAAKFDVSANWDEYDVFREAVVAKLRAAIREGEEVRILGVGSGSGETDCTMIEKLLERFPRINYRVVEPLQEMIFRFEALARSKFHGRHGVSFDWRQQTIEEYKKAGDVTKFNFISVVHSMYFISDMESLLMYLYDRLEPGGVLLIIIMSDTSDVVRFKSRASYSVGRHHYTSSANIRSALERLNIPYTQYHQPAQLEITESFDEDSEEGNLLLDFLTQAVKFRDTAPEDLKRRVIECLSSSEISENIGGKVILANPWDTIVVTNLKQA